MIEVENLSKKYVICHELQSSYATLVDTITKAAKKAYRSATRPFKKQATPPQKTYEDFWALKDVSFSCKEGDRLGIIGSNGAGKSTLLKVLARIIEPTSGRVKIRGKVASLLEVGTGFHPELTGRENIFLNGAILGMAKSEIIKKFDEIVAFSEVEKFLDTPVKYYSSGMYARLGFAIAAHLDPDILIVDEVLAVGDAQFQEKCLKKLKDVSHAGRTVLFVSHNPLAMAALCNKGIYLNKGKVALEGTMEACLQSYMQHQVKKNFFWTGASGNEDFKLTKAGFIHDREFFYHNEEAPLYIEWEIKNPLALRLGFEITNSRHQTIAHSYIPQKFEPGKYSYRYNLPAKYFFEGDYILHIHSSIPGKSLLSEPIKLTLPVFKEPNLSHYQDTSNFEGVLLPNSWKQLDEAFQWKK